MNDKDWLDRVDIAYKVYAKDKSPQLPIEQFIEWLYKQYGIVQKK